MPKFIVDLFIQGSGSSEITEEQRDFVVRRLDTPRSEVVSIASLPKNITLEKLAERILYNDASEICDQCDGVGLELESHDYNCPFLMAYAALYQEDPEKHKDCKAAHEKYMKGQTE